MPRIPETLIQSVIFIFPDEKAALEGRRAGATGFLVDAPNGRFVVTNAHVVSSDGCVLRINKRDGTVDVIRIDTGDWTLHPDGDDYAAAAIVASDEWAVDFLPLLRFVGGTKEEHLSFFLSWNVGVGDDVIMLGRFVGHGGISRNVPLSRFGNIAMMAEDLVRDGRDFRVEAYLVEMRSLAGFSGSPVFLYLPPASYRGNGTMSKFYEEQFVLLGIDTGHKLDSSPVLRKSDQNSAVDDLHVLQNTGISIVSPAWKLLELLADM